MGDPRIVYNPGSGSRNLDFPRELSDLDDPLFPDREIVETDGGVVGVYFPHDHYSVRAAVDLMARDAAFEGEWEDFWAWASKGGEFAFLDDRDDKANTTLTTAPAAGDNSFEVTGVLNLVEGRDYILDPAGTGFRRERITAGTVTSLPKQVTLPVGQTLVYGWSVGDFLRSPVHYPRCAALSRENPLRRVPGNLLSLDFSFRSFKAIAVA